MTVEKEIKNVKRVRDNMSSKIRHTMTVQVHDAARQRIGQWSLVPGYVSSQRYSSICECDCRCIYWAQMNAEGRP